MSKAASKPRKIRGVHYLELAGGVLIPASFVREQLRVGKPEDLFPLLAAERGADVEKLILFTLDGANQVIKKHEISSGIANQCQIHPRETFRAAIADGACSIILAHNHPSGNPEPSDSDLSATRRLAEAGKLLGIPLLDHLIVARDKQLSLRANYPAYFI